MSVANVDHLFWCEVYIALLDQPCNSVLEGDDAVIKAFQVTSRILS